MDGMDGIRVVVGIEHLTVLINICWGKLQKVFMAIFIPPNILMHCRVYMILEMNLSKNLLLKTMN